MTDESKDIKRKFSNIEVAIFIGLLCGVGLVGIYLVGLGVKNMVEPPTIIANGTISDDKIYYIDAYYKSDKRNELTIYNNLQWDEDWVWIGSPIEYSAWKDMKLLDGKIHEFKSSNGRFLIESIKYKTVMRYYGQYENALQDSVVGYKQQIMIVTNDKTTGKKVFKIYEANILGNFDNPEFTLVETNLQPTLTSGEYNYDSK